MKEIALILLTFCFVNCSQSNKDYKLGINYSIDAISQQNQDTWNQFKRKINEPSDEKGKALLLMGEKAFIEYNNFSITLDRLEKKKNNQDSLEIIFKQYCQELSKDKYFYLEYQQVFEEMQNVKTQSVDLYRLYSTILLKDKIEYLRRMVIIDQVRIDYILRIIPTKDKYHIGEDCLAYLDINYSYPNYRWFFNGLKRNGKSISLKSISFDEDRRMVKLLRPEKGKYNINGYSIMTSNQIFLSRTDTVPLEIEFIVE